MIKTEIWCKSSFDRVPEIKAFCALKCELPSIPDKDTLLILHDGWGGATIERMFFNISTNRLYIEIGPDYTGEYKEKAIELGFAKGGPDEE